MQHKIKLQIEKKIFKMRLKIQTEINKKLLKISFKKKWIISSYNIFRDKIRRTKKAKGFTT